MKKITIDQDALMNALPDFINKFIIADAPVIEQPVITDVRDFAKHIYIISDAIIQDGKVVSVPDRKGGEPLKVQGVKKQNYLDSLRYIPQLKGVFLDNENEVYYATDTLSKPYLLPFELHYVIMLPSNFDYEAIINMYGAYVGKTGNKIRLTNGNDTFPDPNPIPLFQYVHLRVKYNSDASGEVFINNKKLQGSQKTFFSQNAAKAFIDHLGFGTYTNNSYVLFSAFYVFGKSLTEAEATSLYNELLAGFNLGNDVPFPFYKNCTVAVKDGIAAISGSYSSPTKIKEDVSKRITKWVIAGNGTNPDVSNSKYELRIDSLDSFSIKKYGLSGYWLRPEVMVTDLSGNCAGVFTSSGFVKI